MHQMEKSLALFLLSPLPLPEPNSTPAPGVSLALGGFTTPAAQEPAC